MKCEDCYARVDDYVDGTLPAAERAEVEQHVASCAACASMARDFRAIRLAAGGLERHVPPAHAWTKLSAALDAERNRGFAGRLAPAVGRFLRGGTAVNVWQPLTAAAMVVLVVGGLSWFVWQQLPATAPATHRTEAPSAADPELVLSVEIELKLAEEHYQKAIAGLEQITATESAALDPQVAAVLRKNLDVIDQAIGESREALQTQPTSEVAQESLFEALRNKVTLLQDTVVLINEMRKGNQEGAARIVSGLNQ